MIEILDCTLRDGGYSNNFNFGKDNILKIIQSLIESDVDIIECGYLKDIAYDENKTFYPDLATFFQLISPINTQNKKIALLIHYGSFAFSSLPKNICQNLILRIAFAKNDLEKVLIDAAALLDKGYKIFLNPTFISQYTDEEILSLLQKIKAYPFYGVGIIDSAGALTSKRAIDVFKLFSENLSANIKIGFHAHNNLGLALENAKTIIEYARQNPKQPLVFDGTINGLGKEGGNLKTEDICSFLKRKSLDIKNP